MLQYNAPTPTTTTPSINTTNKGDKHTKASRSLISKSKLSSLLSQTQRNEIVSKLGKHSNALLVEKKSKQTVIFGLSLMLTSGVLYSGLATLVRWGFDLGYSAAEILMYRASIQMIIAAISYYISHRKIKKSFKNVPSKHIKDQVKKILGRKQILAVIGRGLFGAGSTFTYFEGTTLVDVGDCVTLKALAAVFTSFAGYIILKEVITLKHASALIFALIACILITQPPMIFSAVYSDSRNNSDFKQVLPGYIISTVSSIFQAGVYICIKLAGKTPAVILIFSQGMFSCSLGILVTVFWVEEFHFFSGVVWQEYVCIACICCIGYVAQYTLTRGGQLLIAGLASLMRATDIAWSFVWGIIFFKQYPNILTIVGAVVMFLSVFMVSWEKIKKSVMINEMNMPQRKYTVHTTDVWTVTVEEKNNFNRPTESFIKDSVHKDSAKVMMEKQYSYSVLAEENEQFSDDNATDITLGYTTAGTT